MEQNTSQNQTNERRLSLNRTIANKSLPPLKIRLFFKRSGRFVCYLCKKSYKDKKKLVEHLKEHFLRADWGGEVEKMCEPPKERKKRRKAEQPRKRGGVFSKEKEQTYEFFRNHNRPSTSSKETTKCTDQILENSNPEMDNNQNESFVLDIPTSQSLAMEIDNIDNEIKSVSLESDESDDIAIIEILEKDLSKTSGCIFCGKHFHLLTDLKAHLEVHLQTYLVFGEPENEYACNICGQPFATAKSLREHRCHKTNALIPKQEIPEITFPNSR